ncbi:hypothetical protein HDU88_003429 [Geranomyces variabilis]|nr:hypothetical protein HDU88_003429 [Geranomyces variabilis]
MFEMYYSLDVQDVFSDPTYKSSDLTEKPRLLYAYSVIIHVPSLLSTGWVSRDSAVIFLVAGLNESGMFCSANLTGTPTGCEVLTITALDMSLRGVNYTTANQLFTPEIIPREERLGSFWDPFPVFVSVGQPEPLALMGFSQYQWLGLPITQRGPGSADGLQSITQGLAKFSSVLKVQSKNTLIVTKHTVWRCGIPPGTSTNLDFQEGLLYEKITPTALLPQPFAPVTANSTTNELISRAAAVFLEANGGWGLGDSLSTKIQTSDGSWAFIEIRTVQADAFTRWTILVAIPEDDLIGALKTANKKSAITASVVAIAMLAFAAAASVFVTVPLQRLTNVMTQATEMDFSALKDGFLDRGSVIREVTIMQQVFSKMLQRFAQAIQNNRRLVGGSNSGVRQVHQPTVERTSTITATQDTSPTPSNSSRRPFM